MALFASGAWLPRLAVTAVAGLAMLAAGTAQSAAAPTTDGRGYLDSTARCPTVATTILFGSTDSSRLAICGTPGGGYEYRGVRLRDGAKLIVPATQDADGAYVAENYGVRYVVTSKVLTVSDGQRVLRSESMADFHGTDVPAAAPETPEGPAPAPTAQAVPAPDTPTPTTPLPPPLAAEVGGSGR